jgi:hypothetical protein
MRNLPKTSRSGRSKRLGLFVSSRWRSRSHAACCCLDQPGAPSRATWWCGGAGCCCDGCYSRGGPSAQSTRARSGAALLLRRRGCVPPASASGCEFHRNSITRCVCYSRGGPSAQSTRASRSTRTSDSSSFSCAAAAAESEGNAEEFQMICHGPCGGGSSRSSSHTSSALHIGGRRARSASTVIGRVLQRCGCCKSQLTQGPSRSLHSTS